MDLPGNDIPPTVADEREHEDLITMMNPASQGFFYIQGDTGNGALAFELPGHARTHPNLAGTSEIPPADPWTRPWNSNAPGSATTRTPSLAAAGLLAA
eukprot:15705059-Heterocapsa_arctica.AAC.1